jgi:hypothetical protein
VTAPTCKNCLGPVPEGRLVCSSSCRASLAAKSRHANEAIRAKRRAAGVCPYCRSGNMPRHDDGNHYTSNGRRFPCGAPVRGGQVRTQDLVEEPAADVHATLAAAVKRECAPPWVRHPEPWDNVVLRRVHA